MTGITAEEFIRRKSHNRLKFVREVGRGGFGTVYQFEDTATQQPVCVKVLSNDLFNRLGKDEQRLKFYEQEIQNLEAYRFKSNIAHLYAPLYEDETFQFSQGDPYLFLAMEFVEGEDLGYEKSAIDNFRIDHTELAIHLIFQLCSALHSIHLRGQYHQDLFPDNLRVSMGPSGKKDHLVVLDLGHVRAYKRKSHSALSNIGMYHPPETIYSGFEKFTSIRNERIRYFDRSDIFSLGALFYEMLQLAQHPDDRGGPFTFFKDIAESFELFILFYETYTETSDPDLSQNWRACFEKYDKRGLIPKHEEKREKFKDLLQEVGLDTRIADSLHLLPSHRPDIETLLTIFCNYFLKQGKSLFRIGEPAGYTKCLYWLERITRHFREVEQEAKSNDFISLRDNPMLNHIQRNLKVYIEALLGIGKSYYLLKDPSWGTHFKKAWFTFNLFDHTLSISQKKDIGAKAAINYAFYLSELNRHQEAIEILCQVGRPLHPSLQPIFFNNLGSLYQQIGKTDEAEQCFKQMKMERKMTSMPLGDEI
ncbi:MAG TPA: tetratricopeptide repeat-containing protein kinase family protein [Candidatus Limnocylindrales bacterium]|nr:tetratricopeptide repeat-containing protein kinase family protein [Candidatus Limnocylindrales bacterium]